MSTTPVYALPDSYGALDDLPSADLNTLNDLIELFFVQVGELTGGGVRKSGDFTVTVVPASSNVNISAGVGFPGAAGARKLVSINTISVVTLLYASTWLWLDVDGTIKQSSTNAAPNTDCILIDYAELSGGVSLNANSNPAGRVNLDRLLSARDVAYGELYEDNQAGTNLTVTTAGTYAGWTTSTAGAVSGGNLVTADTTQAAGDRLSAGVLGAGTFEVIARVALRGPNSAIVKAAVHKNGAIQTNLKTMVEFDATAKGESLVIHGFLALASGDYVDLRFTSSTNGDVLVLFDTSLLIRRVGP